MVVETFKKSLMVKTPMAKLVHTRHTKLKAHTLTIGKLGSPALLSLVMVACKSFQVTDFPDSVCPTNITEWREFFVSYSCIT